MIYVVDASVAVKWYIPEIFEREAARLLRGRHDFHVPELIYPEFSNIIWKKIRRNELTQKDGERIIGAISRKRWTIHPHKRIIKSAFTGAQGTGQTVYDWTYLALAVSLSCKFVTADKRFFNSLEKTAFGHYLKWIGDV